MEEKLVSVLRLIADKKRCYTKINSLVLIRTQVKLLNTFHEMN